jgi:Protein of unknown function (DUF4089)
MKRRKPKPMPAKGRVKTRGKKPAAETAAAWDASLVTASAQALGLTIDPAWQANVTFNLQLILRYAALVDEFPLPDDAEPAPVFHA